jgi:hypothetical protein
MFVLMTPLNGTVRDGADGHEYKVHPIVFPAGAIEGFYASRKAFALT